MTLTPLTLINLNYFVIFVAFLIVHKFISHEQVPNNKFNKLQCGDVDEHDKLHGPKAEQSTMVLDGDPLTNDLKISRDQELKGQ